MLRDIDKILEPHVSPVTAPADIILLQQEVKKVCVADNIRRYIISILDNLRHQQDLSSGPSARSSIAILEGSRALAFVQGRDFVIPDDVKRLIVPSLHHRLRIRAEAELDNVTAGDILSKVAAEVPVPKEES